MLKIIYKSIVDDEIIKTSDGIVNSSNPYMIKGSGVCGAIFDKAGVEELENYCKNAYSSNMKTKEVRITPGFNIPCKIIFSKAPKVFDYQNVDEALNDLKDTYINILNASIDNGFKTISIPALGTGVYGFTHEETSIHVLEILNMYKDKIDINLCLSSLNVEKYYKKIYMELNNEK